MKIIVKSICYNEATKAKGGYFFGEEAMVMAYLLQTGQNQVWEARLFYTCFDSI